MAKLLSLTFSNVIVVDKNVYTFLVVALNTVIRSESPSLTTLK